MLPVAQRPTPRRVVVYLVVLALLVTGVALWGRGHALPAPLAKAFAGPSPSLARLRATGREVPPASAWPQAGHDARRGSRTTVTGPTSGHQLWQRRLEGAVSAGPVVGVDGSVLVGSNGGVLHALDPATGSDRWTFDGHGSYGSDLSTSAAVLADGTVLWPGPQDRLWALDAAGRPLWSEQLRGQVLSPAVSGTGRVYVADVTGLLVALDVGPGSRHRRAWRYDLHRASYSSPAVSPTGTVVAGTVGGLTGLQDTGGRARWQWAWTAPRTLEVSPGVAPDGTSVVGLNDRWAYGVDARGRQRWRTDKGDWSYSSAVVTADGRAVLGDHLGRVDVLEAATGRVLARFSTRPPRGPAGLGVGVWTSPVVDGAGRLYVGTAPGHVVAFGPTGRELFDVDVGATVASYPALDAAGRLLVGSQDGVLHAFADPAPAAAPARGVRR